MQKQQENQQKGLTGLTFEQLKSLPIERQKEIVKQIKEIRSDKAKKVNFAGVYGAGPPKIALTASIPLSEAKTLHTAYWKRNKAVKLVSKYAIRKEVGGKLWLYNPISRFWYALREEKDVFSTLNQGTGVFCFDTWVNQVRSRGIQISIQYHDEILFFFKVENKEVVTTKLREAIVEVNNILKLNVELGISIDFGHSYADVH